MASSGSSKDPAVSTVTSMKGPQSQSSPLIVTLTEKGPLAQTAGQASSILGWGILETPCPLPGHPTTPGFF